MAQLSNTPDWSEVIRLAQEYMELLNEDDTSPDDLSDFDAEVFEAVLVALYGKDVFDEINPRLSEL